MKPQEIWRSSDYCGSTRSVTHWWRNGFDAELPPRGFVWIVHGVGEHSLRYNELALFLNQLGFDVLALDLPGHGLSAQKGGQKRLASVTEMLTEIRASFSYWIESGPLASRGLAQVPWNLVGHSMGGLLALAWIVEGNTATEKAMEFARRAYISAPALGLKLKVPAWKLTMAKGLAKVAPDLKLANGIDAEALSYDVANVSAYRNDPLNHPYASPRLFFSIGEMAAKILAHPQDVEIPLCLTVGADDAVVDGDLIKKYFESLHTHKKFLEFPHMKHETFNEIDRKVVFEALAGWFL